MRLVFVNRFYWPETTATAQLLTDLAEGLASRGWTVDVITSAPSRHLPSRDLRNGVRIHRVRGTRWGAHGGAIAKAVDFATFHLGAFGRMLRLAGRGSLVIALSDPPLLGSSALLATRCRGACLAHWVQDIHPEAAIALLGLPWLRLLRPPRDFAWRRSVACIIPGEDMAAVCLATGTPPGVVTVIPNWAPAGLAPLPADRQSPLRRKWRLEGKFVLAYSGNLGRAHDLDSVIELAHRLRDRPDIAIAIIGEGPCRSDMETAAHARGLANISFHPAQPRELQSETLSLGDIHLVTLRPGCERFVLPSKLPGIAAAGRPALFIGPAGCETARLIREHDLGLTGTADDIPGLARRITLLAGDPATLARHCAAARTFASRHTPGAAIARWHELLSSIAGSPPVTTLSSSASAS